MSSLTNTACITNASLNYWNINLKSCGGVGWGFEINIDILYYKYINDWKTKTQVIILGQSDDCRIHVL